MKRVVVVAVVLALSAGGVLVPSVASAQEQRFSDVPVTHEAYEAIEWAAEVELTLGYPDGTFRPGSSLSRRHALVFMERYYDDILGSVQSDDFTRADMMVLLHRISSGGDPASADSEGSFSDVPADHYAFGAIEWAAEVELTLGYPDGTFRPEQALSRRHALVFMERYYDDILESAQSDDFTRGDMMVLLNAINDGSIRGASTQQPDGPAEPPSPRSFVSVSVSGTHACGLRANGSVTCWAITDAVAGDALRAPAGKFVQISAGDYYSCGLRESGKIDCWGFNSAVDFTHVPTAGGRLITEIPTGTFQKVSASIRVACALRTDKTVACWGGKVFPDDRAYFSRDIVNETPSGQFIDLVVWNAAACGVRVGGSIECWGHNSDILPTPKDGVFTQVASNECALRIDSTVECWGYGDEPTGTFTKISGHCGLRSNGTIECWNRDYVGPPGKFVDVSAQADTDACGVRIDGKIKCWGGDYDLLDLADWERCKLFEQEHDPCPPRGLYLPLDEVPSGAFIAVSSSARGACGLRTDGTVECWGPDYRYSRNLRPVGKYTQISGFCGIRADMSVDCWRFSNPDDVANVAAISQYGDRACGVRIDGSAFCWGRGNDFGQQDPPPGEFLSVSVGYGKACGLRSDRSVECWGNSYGRSNDPFANRESGTRFTSISVGGRHQPCALRGEGSVVCRTRGPFPGEVDPPGGTFTAISSGDFQACGLRPDGAVECWGLSPIWPAVDPPAGRFTAISVGEAHTCGLRPDGTIECWGVLSVIS